MRVGLDVGLGVKVGVELGIAVANGLGRLAAAWQDNSVNKISPIRKMKSFFFFIISPSSFKESSLNAAGRNLRSPRWQVACFLTEPQGWQLDLYSFCDQVRKSGGLQA